ncbi:MAG: hypothetical protein K2O91_26780 [Lachnospiraceae bacterium]|nr:hypothetical protein [Lachnospiraceae bacterium]
MECEELENCVKWLGGDITCNIINVIRNICMVKGSEFKRRRLDKGGLRKTTCYNMLRHPSINKRNFVKCDRLIVRFEDLKCNPRETLLKICDTWGINWSDTLLETTCKGKPQSVNNREREISGFDLEPVYNTYEKYFSEFDRFRIMLISSPYQKNMDIHMLKYLCFLIENYRIYSIKNFVLKIC